MKASAADGMGDRLGILVQAGLARRGGEGLPGVRYVEGNQELLDEVRILWEELNEHHRMKSKYFASGFKDRTFESRKTGLLAKVKTGALRVEMVKESGTGRLVGYCICSVSCGKVGEVDSIYIVPEYRRLGIGDRLMDRALTWMDKYRVDKKVVSVAGGNEGVFSFYGRYGFHPRTIILEQAPGGE